MDELEKELDALIADIDNRHYHRIVADIKHLKSLYLAEKEEANRRINFFAQLEPALERIKEQKFNHHQDEPRMWTEQPIVKDKPDDCKGCDVIDYQDMKRMVEGFIAGKNFVPTTSLCEAYLELQKELAFYRSNCIVLEEGAEPEQGDIVTWENDSEKSFFTEIIGHHATKKGEYYCETRGTRFWVYDSANIKIIQRQGNPVIIKSKEVRDAD